VDALGGALRHRHNFADTLAGEPFGGRAPSTRII